MIDTPTQYSLLTNGFGGMFALLAAFFVLGLVPRLARHFYPAAPSLPRRLVAPVLFALISAACFRGFGMQALVTIVALGIPLILATRWRSRS